MSHNKQGKSFVSSAGESASAPTVFVGNKLQLQQQRKRKQDGLDGEPRPVKAKYVPCKFKQIFY